jgi:uncharacterized protein YkwD
MASLLVAMVPAQARARHCFRIRDSERAFLKKVNATRARHGRRPLTLDKQLSFVARHHTWSMKSNGYLFHTSFSQFNRWVTRWRDVGENVGVGPSVKSIYRAFLRSPEHYANIMGAPARYNHIGVGVVKSHGRVWVTLQFEDRHDPGTRLDMPRSC